MDKNLQYTLSLKDLFSNKMKDAENATSRMDSKMNSFGSKLAALAGGIGISYLAKGIIETGASFEMAEVQLKTLLKSSSEAKRVFQDLQQEATKSPFSFETLLKGNAALISTGLSAKDAKQDFTALANAVAATGGTEDTLQRMVLNLQQIKNVGKATAIDIKQFGMAGINVYAQLNKYYEKNHIALKDQQGSYEQLTGALKLAASQGGDYFNALNNMSNTTSGRLSNLKDSFQNFQNQLFVKLKPTIDLVVTALTNLMGFIVRHLDTIGTLTKYILLGVTALYAYRTIMWSISAVQGAKFVYALVSMTAGLQGTTVAQYALNLAMELNPIGIVVIAVTALIAAIMWLNNMMDKTISNFETLAAKDATASLKTTMSTVDALSASYQKMGKSKEEANKMATNEMLSRADKTIAKLQPAVKAGEKGAAWAVAQLQMQKKELANHFKTGLGTETNASIGSLSAKGGKKESGSGTEISGTKPQSIIINITKLVESLNVNTTNLKESAQAIREEVSKALLESVNDVNMLAR